MVTRLQEVNAIGAYGIDHTMLLCSASQPRTSEDVLQGFWLAYPGKWVAHGGFDEVDNPKRHAPIGFHPKSQVLAKLGMEDGEAFRFFRQDRTRAEAGRSTWLSTFGYERAPARQAVAGNFSAIAAGARFRLAMRARQPQPAQHRERRDDE